VLATRVIASLVFVPALVAVIYVGGLALDLACLALCLVMLWEFLRLTLGDGVGLGKTLAFALVAAVAAGTLGWLPSPVDGLLLPAVTVALLLAALARPEPLHASVQRTALLLLGVVYTGGMLPFLARLRGLEQGLGFSLMALFCAWGADTGAYFVGRRFGRHRLYPSVSPGKTVEGAMGGTATAVGVAALARAVLSLDLEIAHALVLGVLAAVVGTAGDLCESMLKRSVGAKDSSALIPGHGGVLDRFDALLFVAPSFFAYLLATGHGQPLP
jgi:phosphatidate cytidylyltransferase